MSAPAFPYDVFLSHSAKDKAVVRLLAERLRADGLKVWFDEWVLKPGDSIPAKIEEGLEHSRLLVLCMSANAFGSDWAQLEAGTFRFRDPQNKERRFIPLRLDEATIKGSLAQFLYINWRPVVREQEYAKLFDACRHPVNWPPPDNAVVGGEPIGELEIEGVQLDIVSHSKHLCQVRIHNRSSARTAENVQVELAEFEDALGNGQQADYFRPVLPIALRPGRPSGDTINPGGSTKYDLFHVTKNIKTATLARDGAVAGWQQMVIAYFTHETTTNLTQFACNKPYRLRFIVTARDLRKIEQDFQLLFSEQGELCRFSLTPASSRSTRETAIENRTSLVEALARFRFALRTRAGAIGKMASDQYHQVKMDGTDQKTSKLLAEIETYFTQNPTDLGVAALADLTSKEGMDRSPIHCIYGCTIYHDDWEQVQRWLFQLEKNLARIIDKLGSKPL